MSVKFDSGGRRRKNPGFAAAVGLCLAAVCLVAAATVINNRTDKNDEGGYISEYVSQQGESVWLGVENTEDSEEVYIDTQPSDEDFADDGNIPADSTALTEDSTTEPSEEQSTEVWSEIGDEPDGTVSADDMALDSGDDEAVAVSAKVSYRMPLAGEIINGFSGEELVYCSTMGDWRVHQGVDISGTSDCEVRACADGVVVDFTEDMLYGYTAIIEQEDGSMLYYCGLTSVPKVTAGLVVKAGDVIGYLGTVPCEAGEQPHLHLSMMKDGTFVDPIRVMGL